MHNLPQIPAIFQPSKNALIDDAEAAEHHRMLKEPIAVLVGL